jgi:hypothetical protein
MSAPSMRTVRTTHEAHTRSRSHSPHPHRGTAKTRHKEPSREISRIYIDAVTVHSNRIMDTSCRRSIASSSNTSQTDTKEVTVHSAREREREAALSRCAPKLHDESPLLLLKSSGVPEHKCDPGVHVVDEPCGHAHCDDTSLKYGGSVHQRDPGVSVHVSSQQHQLPPHKSLASEEMHDQDLLADSACRGGSLSPLRLQSRGCARGESVSPIRAHGAHIEEVSTSAVPSERDEFLKKSSTGPYCTHTDDDSKSTSCMRGERESPTQTARCCTHTNRVNMSPLRSARCARGGHRGSSSRVRSAQAHVEACRKPPPQGLHRPTTSARGGLEACLCGRCDLAYVAAATNKHIETLSPTVYARGGSEIAPEAKDHMHVTAPPARIQPLNLGGGSFVEARLQRVHVAKFSREEERVRDNITNSRDLSVKFEQGNSPRSVCRLEVRDKDSEYAQCSSKESYHRDGDPLHYLGASDAHDHDRGHDRDVPDMPTVSEQLDMEPTPRLNHASPDSFGLNLSQQSYSENCGGSSMSPTHGREDGLRRMNLRHGKDHNLHVSSDLSRLDLELRLRPSHASPASLGVSLSPMRRKSQRMPATREQLNMEMAPCHTHEASVDICHDLNLSPKHGLNLSPKHVKSSSRSPNLSPTQPATRKGLNLSLSHAQSPKHGLNLSPSHGTQMGLNLSPSHGTQMGLNLSPAHGTQMGLNLSPLHGESPKHSSNPSVSPKALVKSPLVRGACVCFCACIYIHCAVLCVYIRMCLCMCAM